MSGWVETDDGYRFLVFWATDFEPNRTKDGEYIGSVLNSDNEQVARTTGNNYEDTKQRLLVMLDKHRKGESK